MSLLEYLSDGTTWVNGIWLDCRSCQVSARIKGSGVPGSHWSLAPLEQCAAIFRQHGWQGEGVTMLKAKCPSCVRFCNDHK